MTAGRSNLVDLDLTVRIQTARAVCVVNDDEEDVWLPMSQIEIEENSDGTHRITMPEWLAIDRGLI